MEEGNASSNAQIPIQDYGNYEKSEEHDFTKGNCKPLVTDPKIMKIQEMSDKEFKIIVLKMFINYKIINKSIKSEKQYNKMRSSTK